MNDKLKKVVLIYATPEGSREFALENGELKVGRGEVDLRFPDSSLSRHHATIYREEDRVWILDNNSTNGTFVNGAPAAPNGTILQNGDTIRLGNDTTIRIQFSEPKTSLSKSASAANQNILSGANSTSFNFVPLIIAGIAVVVIGLAVVVVVSKAISSSDSNTEIAETNQDDSVDDNSSDEPEENTNSKKKKPKVERSPDAVNANAEASPEKPDEKPVEPKPNLPVAPTRTYLEMSETEKRQFIEKEARQVAQMIGNTSGDAVPPEAVERIKSFVDAYAKRLKYAKRDGTCSFTRDNLETLISRASQNAHFIVPAFNSQGLAPQIGLYLAMIESEHCVCLQSPTGPLGMFQFTKATGKQFGLETKPGASPTNPDERCEPNKAAPAAAKYMKFLTGRYGTGSLSVPLAIASYNSGEGGLSTNLQTALAGESNQERSFWTLVSNQGKLSSQFQKENIKYVPKFFAAAIVGENPIVFGVKMPPISSNSK
ncbi:MAG: FHA domain-containing protein [Pyrinomonadaceae bacterium]